MKKFILLFCFLALTSPKIYSQLFIENFEYTAIPPTILSTTAPWEPISASGVLPILADLPSGLSFPNYAGSGVGNAVTLQDVTGEDDTARFTSPPVTSGSVYASFMLSAVSATATGAYFFGLMTEGNAQDARVYARDDAGLLGYNLGIQKSGSATINYSTQVFSFLTTYLVVVKYTFNAGAADDQMSLFVFAPGDIVPAVEPTPTLGPLTQGGTDAPDLVAVLLRQDALTTSAEAIIDGIYVNTAWDNGVLPVELSSFTSVINERDVTLNWSTASEINNSVFEIERSSNGSWSKVGEVSGNGTSNTQHNYSFADRSLASGNYGYRLKQIDYNGSYEYFNLNNEVVIGLPVSYTLEQNYPNPFNPTTVINYQLQKSGNVSIKLFDLSGKEIRTLVNEMKDAGYYSVKLDASGLSSGVYFYSIVANDFSNTKSMLLVK